MGGDETTAMPPLRVLVLEDEMLVSMLLQDMIGELGCTIVGPAPTVVDALELIEREEIGAALVDLNFSEGGSGYAVADVLAARDVPFAFVTGYGRTALRDPYRDRPILQKPFQMEALRRMLASLAAASGR